MQTSRKPETILGLDVGERRIGVARVHMSALFPAPLTTLENPESFVTDIVALCETEAVAAVVVGLPRGLSGQETAQTAAVEDFAEQLQEVLPVPLYFTDEAVTSEKAEAELKQRGKPYVKADIDALAATYILEDFITEHPEVVRG